MTLSERIRLREQAAQDRAWERLREADRHLLTIEEMTQKFNENPRRGHDWTLGLGISFVILAIFIAIWAIYG